MGFVINFKECYRNYKIFFWYVNKRNVIELLKYVWKLKDVKIFFSLKWKVIRKCNFYNNVIKKCSLCFYEKFVIICRKDLCILNKWNELVILCFYRNRYVF